jgi:hypothetical protein
VTGLAGTRTWRISCAPTGLAVRATPYPVACTMIRMSLTLLLLLANAWAIAAVLGSRRPASARAAWSLGIAAVPVAGFAAWLFAGPRAAPPQRRRQ